jgi:alginate O-acetyltransferase complex protein AlgI
MLFNSAEFIFVFLPITFVLYHLLAGSGRRRFAMAFLTAASLFYYSYWDINNLPLIAASILFNYAVGSLICRRRSKSLLVFGVGVNLLALAYYKYADFFVTTLNEVSGAGFAVPHIALPLAISFFTFTQIAYLADMYMEREYFAPSCGGGGGG